MNAGGVLNTCKSNGYLVSTKDTWWLKSEGSRAKKVAESAGKNECTEAKWNAKRIKEPESGVTVAGSNWQEGGRSVTRSDGTREAIH